MYAARLASRRFLQSAPRRALLAVLIVGVLMLSLLCCTDITFETNDDCLITAITSGAMTGSPNPATVYTSYLYGLLLCGLYGLSAAVPWHGALLMALNVFSLAVVLYGLLTVCAARGLPVALAPLVFLGLFLGVYLMFVAQLQFTAVSGMTFLAALMLLLCLPRTAGARLRRAHWTCCAALLLFSFLLRPKVALMLSPFLALYALSAALGAGGRRKALYACSALLALGALWLADGALYAAEPDWAGYQAYDEQTTAFLDYNAYGLTDEQRAAALQAAGWPDELFTFVKDWYFLDERINTESLSALNASLEAAAPPQPFFNRLTGAVYAAASVLRRYPFFGLNYLAYALAACAALWAALRTKNRGSAVWLAGSFGYSFTLIVVFYGFLNRFPLRLAFSAAALPLTTLLPCVGFLLPDTREPALQKRRAAAVLAALLALSGLASFALNGREGLAPRDQFSISRYNDGVMREVSEYVSAHPDTVYVTNLSVDFLPFSVFPSGAFSNLIVWGSGVHSSPAWMEQLAALGYDRFDARSFFDANVRLLLTRSTGVRERLESYLQNDYAAKALATVEERDSFMICQAIR